MTTESDNAEAVNTHDPASSEELIHKAEDAQIKDPNEPKVYSSLQLFRVIGFDIIWILIGTFFAMGQGIIPVGKM
jgi:hypothetical protein